MDAKPPVRELGNQTGYRTPGILSQWTNIAEDTLEHVPDLTWPLNVQTYRRMRRQDSQVQALALGIEMPIRSQYRLVLHPEGLSDTLAQALADDLDIPIAGQDHAPTGRRTGRVSIAKHRATALQALWIGHSVFELVAEKPGADGLYHLTKLAHRPQHTIGRWSADKNGEWDAIEQSLGWPPTLIPRSKLLVYTWADDDDGNPRGQSLLRALYRHWVAKDKLYRIDIMAHERHGVGVPFGEITDDRGTANRDELLAILSGIGSGPDTAVVTPMGTKGSIQGVNGSISQPIESAKYHDELMARALLAMVMSLGQGNSTGNRALGDVHMDMLGMFHALVAQWEAATLTEQVVEAWTSWNVDGDTGAYVAAERVDDGSLPTETLQQLVDAGLLVPDDTLRTVIRQKLELPAADDPTEKPAAPADLQQGSDALFAAGDLPMPDRQLGREPTDRERRAKIDVRALDAAHDQVGADVLAALVEMWQVLLKDARRFVADTADVRDPGFPDALTAALVGAIPDDPRLTIVETLTDAVQQGLGQIEGEAERQGAPIAQTSVAAQQAAEVQAEQITTQVARAVAAQVATEAARLAPQDTPAGAPIASAVIAAVVAQGAKTPSTPGAEPTMGPPRYVQDQAAGAASEALFRGQSAVLRENEQQIDELWAMELLDANTCDECARIDNKTYNGLDAAMRDYPTGKYRLCEGRLRCRGRLGVLFKTRDD